MYSLSHYFKNCVTSTTKGTARGRRCWISLRAESVVDIEILLSWESGMLVGENVPIGLSCQWTVCMSVPKHALNNVNYFLCKHWKHGLTKRLRRGEFQGLKRFHRMVLGWTIHVLRVCLWFVCSESKDCGGRGWVLPADLFEPGTLSLSQREKETRGNPAFCARRRLKVSHGSLSSVSTVCLPFNLSFFLSFAFKKQDVWWNKKKNNKKKPVEYVARCALR